MTEHANAARSVIAFAISGRHPEPNDQCYADAADVLEELDLAGLIVVEKGNCHA